MENKYENGMLTIKLNTSINSDNAKKTEDEIFALIESNSPKSVVLDAENTEYISSAGLRIVLKLKKMTDALRVINASPALYDVFEITGFSNIIDVEKALRQVSVEGCKVIGEGGFGIVYRLDEDTIVKIYKSAGIDSIKREIEYAKQAFIKGVPTAISYDIVKCGDRYGVVLEMIRSDMLANRMVAEPEKFDEYMDKYVDLIRCVHSTDFSDVDCPRADQSYYDLFEKFIKENVSEKEWAAFTDILASVPKRQNMIHGDMHGKNIMVQNDELLLIDMDELMRGHPIYDIADIYYAYKYLPKTGRSERFLNMDEETCGRFIDTFTKKYFKGYDENTLEKAMKGICAFAQLRGIHAVLLVLSAGNGRIKDPKARIAQLIHILKEEVLPYGDEIKEAVKIM